MSSAHVENEEQYIQALERFTDNTVYKDDPEMSDYFLRFASFTKELTGLFKNLVSQSLTSSISIRSFCYEYFRPVFVLPVARKQLTALFRKYCLSRAFSQLDFTLCLKLLISCFVPTAAEHE